MRTDRGLQNAEWLLFRILHFSFNCVCANRRKEHPDQNGDYRDDHEQFDERKVGAIFRRPLYAWLRFYTRVSNEFSVRLLFVATERRMALLLMSFLLISY